MRIELTELVWLGDDNGQVSLDELAALSGLTSAELQALAEEGALSQIEPAGEPLYFSSACVVTARIAGRLKNDFQLDTSGLSVALTLLERIRDLEQQVQRLQAQLPQRHP